MDALTFWKMTVMDRADSLERVIQMLQSQGIRFCVLGGQAVNAYAEPVVSLDLDLAMAIQQVDEARELFEREFEVEPFEHSLNVTIPHSDLRIQIQTDPRYSRFVKRAQERLVLGLKLPVARIDDVLQGKIWAFQDPSRRASKRQKDLADISRLLEAQPNLRRQVPEEILERLV